jgi:hypothetical protein
MTVVSPQPEVDLYIDYDRGFHSNDARGAVRKVDQANLIVLFQPISGLPFREASSEVVYDFDDLCVERVDAEQVDGWAVTPGRVAYCHIGYAPLAAKIAISSDRSPEFSIVDVASGKNAATLPAVEVTNRRGSFVCWTLHPLTDLVPISCATDQPSASRSRSPRSMADRAMRR